MVLSILSGTGSLHKRIPEFSSPVLILEEAHSLKNILHLSLS